MHRGLERSHLKVVPGILVPHWNTGTLEFFSSTSFISPKKRRWRSVNFESTSIRGKNPNIFFLKTRFEREIPYLPFLSFFVPFIPSPRSDAMVVAKEAGKVKGELWRREDNEIHLLSPGGGDLLLHGNKKTSQKLRF